MRQRIVVVVEEVHQVEVHPSNSGGGSSNSGSCGCGCDMSCAPPPKDPQCGVIMSCA